MRRPRTAFIRPVRKGDLMAHKYSPKRLFAEHVERFFKEVEIGQVYEYYFGHFLYRDVVRIAERYGVKIQYLKRGDPRRKGSYSFVVTDTPDRIEVNREPVMFSVEELAI